MTPAEWRQRRRQQTMETIKRAARQQIAESGAGNLSLGAVARSLGMTPPALYRYFDNRDALVAALIIDAYGSMGEALERAAEGLPPDDYAGRFLALMRAYRHWATTYPEDFGLMYGLPTADVGMSQEQLAAFQGAVLRSMRAMVQVLHAAYVAGRLVIPTPYQEPPPPVRQALIWMQAALADPSIPLGVLALAFTTWLFAEGLVWQELHGHLPKAMFGSGDFYEMESRVLLERLGLDEHRGEHSQ
jgi:AcrR family transcriptional regulator